MSATPIATLAGFRYWYPGADVASVDGVDLGTLSMNGAFFRISAAASF